MVNDINIVYSIALHYALFKNQLFCYTNLALLHFVCFVIAKQTGGLARRSLSTAKSVGGAWRSW